MSSQHTSHARTPTASTTSYHNNHYRVFHYPSASNASIHSRDPVSPLLPSSPVPWSPPRSTPVQNNAYDLASASPLVSPIMSRSPSVADSDRYSTISSVTGYWPQNPDNVSPAAAYVAPFGAVQVVNEHRAAARARRSSDASDDEDNHYAKSKAEAQFSPQALTLINHFLDQLLYSFLSTAKSTNLHALRPAVAEVLRHRLAKEAVANADEELHELLAGGEEDEERNALAQVSSRDSRKWDLELVWKRTRLRVMVYMRLGEMEDDDEERFVKEQELFYGREMDSRRFSSSSGLVSWSAAIFLTSVLEYIAEQSLQAAGSAAYARARRPSTSRSETPPLRQVKVEDFDVERLALDARLGRLWRTWRKTTRNDRQRPITPSHRGVPSISSFTRDRAVSLSALRRPSTGLARDDSTAAEEYRAIKQQYIRGMGGPGYDYPETDYPEHVLASNIPLPMRDAKRDVDEIEVPGLAKSYDEDTEEEAQASQTRRYTYASPANEKFATSTAQQAEPKSVSSPTTKSNFAIARQRSQSMPSQPRTPNLEIPGAFPNMPEEREIPRASVVQETTSDYNAKALGLQDINSEREEPKVLLNDVSRKVDGGEAAVSEREHAGESVETAPHVAGQETDLPKTETAEEETRSEDQAPALFTGVAAGATAVAGAALAAAGTSHHKNQDQVESREEGLDQSREQLDQSSGVALPQPRERSAEEIEELDNGKSLIDLKYYIKDESRPRSGEGFATRAVPSDTPTPAPESAQKMPQDNGFSSADAVDAHQSGSYSNPVDQAVSSDSAILTKSQEPSHIGKLSDSEAPLEATSIANPEESAPSPESRKEGGHSRQDTATIAALEAPASPSETSDYIRSEQKARDMPMIGSPKPSEKPGRLIINGESQLNENKLSPIDVNVAQAYQSSAAPKSPREFIKSRDLSSDSETPLPLSRDYVVQSPNEQTRANARRPVTAASMASESEDHVRDLRTVQSAREQAKHESPQNRKSNGAHQKQNSRGEIQDHPAIQGMATPKKEKFVIATPASGTSTPPVVTSASIRGPEDFDNFLQRDTVKYTLTPETVRDQQSRPTTDDSKSLKNRTSQGASLANVAGQISDVASKRSSQRKDSDARSSKHQSRASRSQSIKDVTAVSPQQTIEPARERRRSISKPAPRNTSSHRRSGLMAREPQVMTASTRDFADFIRSTGPDREQEVKRIHTSRSVNSLHSMQSAGRSQSVGAGSIQGERTKSMTHSNMVAENIPPVPKMPSESSRLSKGPPLQARSATGAASGNKDLINFIRDGPDEEGSHRISRSVAPFRNTMDSDQFGEMGGDFASSAPPSKPSTDSQPTPVHRTIPSPTEDIPAQRLAAVPEPEDGRKRYRNKDPYALPSDDEDDDDDDEDFLTALPRKNQRPKEESLVEFLRNNEPPNNNAPRPISSAAATANLNKGRQSAATTDASATQPHTNPNPQPPSNFSPSNLNSTPRPPPPPPTIPKLEARGAGAPRKTIPRGNAGARLGAYEQSNTGDLADFLRSSGPTEEAWPAAPKRFEPPALPEAGSPSPLKKERKKSFFSRFRKEKV
ncbi:hypothetical protein MBLNU13_g08037t2 [Cladosporium sp. NU13]